MTITTSNLNNIIISRASSVTYVNSAHDHQREIDHKDTLGQLISGQILYIKDLKMMIKNNYVNSFSKNCVS